MDISSPEGTKVKCINHSEFTKNWGDNDSPEDLIIGDIYTVDKTEIHSWHTKVFLKEFPGKKFGSSHFASVISTGEEIAHLKLKIENLETEIENLEKERQSIEDKLLELSV